MIFIDTEEAGLALFEAYPHFLNIGGQQVVAKKGGNINGVYYGKDELISLYAKKIGNDIVKHNSIIEAIEKAKQQNVINFTLRDFIYNELWDAFIDLEGRTSKTKMI